MMTRGTDDTIVLDFSERLSIAFHLRTAADVYYADAGRIETGDQIETTSRLAAQFRAQATQARAWADALESM